MRLERGRFVIGAYRYNQVVTLSLAGDKFLGFAKHNFYQSEMYALYFWWWFVFVEVK